MVKNNPTFKIDSEKLKHQKLENSGGRRLGLGGMTEKDRRLLDWVNNEKSCGNILSEFLRLRRELVGRTGGLSPAEIEDAIAAVRKKG
jgi:hypothetical protein